MAPSLLFNLADFGRDILRPSASVFSRAMSTRRKASSFAEMVAGFFWLLFGLDAEYFPEEHAQSLFISEGLAIGGPDEIIDQDTIASGFLDVVSYMRILVGLSNALRREEGKQSPGCVSTGSVN